MGPPAPRHGASGDAAPLAASRDGRITAGHFSLLRRLRAEDRLDGLVLFDGHARDLAFGPGWWNQRDERMARGVIDGWDRAGAMVVVAGGLHTRSAPIVLTGPGVSPLGRSLARDMPGVDALRPLGTHVAAGGIPLLEGRIACLSGSINNMGVRRIGGRARPGAHPRFLLGGDGVVVFELPVATPAVVPG